MEIRIYEVKENPANELTEALAGGFTHMLTLASGQPENSLLREKLVQHCQSNPWASIAGVCEEEFTEFNVYPLFYLQHSRFYFPAEFFHREAHTKLSLQNIPCVRLPVKQASEIKIKSLKQKFYDLLMTGLFSLFKQLKIADRPLHSSVSLAFGIFVACSPFYGIQTLITLVIGALCRLNLPLAILGSQFSLPPLYALILPAELYVGFQLTGYKWTVDGDWLDVAQSHFSAWFVGFLVVGSLLAVVIGFCWWFMQSQWILRKKVNWTGKFRGSVKGLEFLVFLLKNLGQWSAYTFLYGIVPYYYLFAPKARRGLNQYWKILKPDESWLFRQLRILKHEMIFARTLVDRVFQFTQKEIPFDIHYERRESIQSSVESSNSSVLLFSHFGGWDIAARKFSEKNLSKKISMIEYEFQGHSFNKLVKNQTPSHVNKIFVTGKEPIFMKIHDVLRLGGNLALMGDRPVDHNIELIPFMGKLAPIPVTPFRLAKIYSSDLIFSSCARVDRKNYRLIIEKRKLNNKNDDVLNLARSYVAYLEERISENPYQWFNFYNFWSSVPTLPHGELCLPQKYTLREPYSPSFSP